MSTSEATAGQTPDMYGQVHPIETPELIAQKLVEFETELSKLSSGTSSEKAHVTQAEALCPELLTDDFKLMFLRCEVFNADLAAKRYCKYWTNRVDIFGPDRAFLPLTLGVGGALQDDETHIALGLGVITLLSSANDPMGRAVVYVDPGKMDRTRYVPTVLVRAFWYVIHAAVEDGNAQRHGVVFISDPGRAKFSQFDQTFSKMFITSLKGALPVRLSCMHIVRPPGFFSIVFPIVKVFLSEQMRKRIRLHNGKVEMIAEAFQTKYGLKKDALPTTIGGSLKTQHIEWVESRKALGL
jgi:hypothetical protein